MSSGSVVSSDSESNSQGSYSGCSSSDEERKRVEERKRAEDAEREGSSAESDEEENAEELAKLHERYKKMQREELLKECASNMHEGL